jgi:hypothetical protein
MGLAVARVMRHPVALGPTLVVLVTLAASLNSMHPLYADTSNPDWRSAARDLQRAYRPGQAVVYAPGVLQSLVTAYLPSAWRPTRSYPVWYHAYLDVPGWTQRYRGLMHRELSDHRGLRLGLRYARVDGVLRDIELRAATRGEQHVWLVSQDYAGTTDTRTWFADHGFHLLLSQIYDNDARIELWSRGLPPSFGPRVLGSPDSGSGWRRSSQVTIHPGVVTEQGRAALRASFPVSAGAAYSVNVEYRSFPPALPSVRLQTFDRSGKVVGGIHNGLGWYLDSFPRTTWYDMPVNGVWISQPFGFIAPPGAVRATLSLQNGWGMTAWRHIAVYRER